MRQCSSGGEKRRDGQSRIKVAYVRRACNGPNRTGEKTASERDLDLSLGALFDRLKAGPVADLLLVDRLLTDEQDVEWH